MTSNELLNIIDKSTLKNDVEKKSLYKEYFPLIEAILTYAPNKMELPEISSLDGIKNVDDFEIFIRDNDYETVKDRLERILIQLKTYAEVSIVGNEWLKGHHHKNFVKSIVFIVGLAVMSAAVFVFSILDLLGILPTNGLASGICGSIDFLFGVIFFIYEFVSDKKVKDLNKDMGENFGNFVSNSKIKHKGNNGNFGIQYNYTETSDDNNQELQGSFVRNSNIEDEGDNNNYGIQYNTSNQKLNKCVANFVKKYEK